MTNLTLEHIDPRKGELVCGLCNEFNEILADRSYNSRKTNRFVPYRVCGLPAPVTFGDVGEFLIGGEWTVCEFGGPEWWEESNKIGNATVKGGVVGGSRNTESQRATRYENGSNKLRSLNEERHRKKNKEGKSLFNLQLNSDLHKEKDENGKSKHAVRMGQLGGGSKPSPEHLEKISSEVMCLETKAFYPSTREAERKTGSKNVARSARSNGRLSAGGTHWVYTASLPL